MEAIACCWDIEGCPFWLAQLQRMARDPSHSPSMELSARSASARSRKATNPYPRDLPVFISHMTRASETGPNVEKACRRTSSLTSLDKSPTKMWKWLDVSSLAVLFD